MISFPSEIFLLSFIYKLLIINDLQLSLPRVYVLEPAFVKTEVTLRPERRPDAVHRTKLESVRLR
jgi:hypothetical protein